MKQLIPVLASELDKNPSEYELPIAQEDLRAGHMAFIDYIADAETFGVFEIDPTVIQNPYREQLGMPVVGVSRGQPALLFARGDIGDSPTASIFGFDEPQIWAVKIL